MIASDSITHRDSPWRRGRCHALWLHQRGCCFHCGCAMPDPLAQRPRHRLRAGTSATIDHVLPRSLGGMEAWLNEVAACRTCNSAKADRLPLAVELWRLAWLKGDRLAAHALEPEAVLASLRQQEVAGAEVGAILQGDHDALAIGAVAVRIE
ncbi:MAG: HNH endonuclease [Rhodospirillaceae bacterium]|nr:HNH endonuclease [Rhodospirillales bacterium]